MARISGVGIAVAVSTRDIWGGVDVGVDRFVGWAVGMIVIVDVNVEVMDGTWSVGTAMRVFRAEHADTKNSRQEARRILRVFCFRCMLGPLVRKD